jgi:hypothetical protein
MSGTHEYRRLESVRSVNLPIGIKGARSIPLTQGMLAIVDEEDYESLMKFLWQAVFKKGESTYYATRRNGKALQSMHRQIMGLKTGDKGMIDHVNRNGLDNRKSNLRITKNPLNSYNKKHMSNNKSGYRGVCWSKPHNQWVARVGFHGKSIFCGRFKDLISAAKSYDRKAIILWKENAILNFPLENYNEGIVSSKK